MLTESQERLLMERTAEGDRSAFRQLFDNYYPVVFGFMKSLLQVKEDASDVAQEAFIAAVVSRMPEQRRKIFIMVRLLIILFRVVMEVLMLIRMI